MTAPVLDAAKTILPAVQVLDPPITARALDDFRRAILHALRRSDSGTAIELAVSIDFHIGPRLARRFNSGDGVAAVASAVNAANNALLPLRCAGTQPIVLLSRTWRYWRERQQALARFSEFPQGVETFFNHLLPATCPFRSAVYSAVITGSGKERGSVSLFPVIFEGKLDAEFAATFTAGDVRGFRFKTWNDLSLEQQTSHLAIARTVADHIAAGVDAAREVHVVVLPELSLVPEAATAIEQAVRDRRKTGTWLVFPGSYHVAGSSDTINRAIVLPGGAAEPSQLTRHADGTSVAAVKRTPFRQRQGPYNLVEDITAAESHIHLIDTDIGRLAAVICRDFLELDILSELASMEPDHLLVLAMSGDTGPKFTQSMDILSNHGISTFFVNAFEKHPKRRAVAVREPLKSAKVEPADGQVAKPPFRHEVEPA